MKKMFALAAGLGISLTMIGCGPARPGPQADPNAPPGATERGGTSPRAPIKESKDAKPTADDAKPADPGEKKE